MIPAFSVRPLARRRAMCLFQLVALMATGAMCLTESARADSVTESTVSASGGEAEFGGDRASAFDLNGRLSASSNGVDDNVYGQNGEPTVSITAGIQGRDIDFFSFSGVAGQQFYFDIDEEISSFRPFLSLFDSQGILLAYNGFNGASPDPGDSSQPQSFIGVYTLPADGTYYITVSDSSITPRIPSGGVPLFHPNTGEFGSGEQAGTATTDASSNDTFSGTPPRLMSPLFRYTLHVTTTRASAPGGAASLIVTTNEDISDPNDAVNSLREAVAFANSQPGFDVKTITFAGKVRGTLTLSSPISIRPLS